MRESRQSQKLSHFYNMVKNVKKYPSPLIVPVDVEENSKINGSLSNVSTISWAVLLFNDSSPSSYM